MLRQLYYFRWHLLLITLHYYLYIYICVITNILYLHFHHTKHRTPIKQKNATKNLKLPGEECTQRWIQAIIILNLKTIGSRNYLSTCKTAITIIQQNVSEIRFHTAKAKLHYSVSRLMAFLSVYNKSHESYKTKNLNFQREVNSNKKRQQKWQRLASASFLH